MVFMIKGIPAAPGLAMGNAVVFQGGPETANLDSPESRIAPGLVASELERARAAVDSAAAEIRRLAETLSARTGEEAAAIFFAQEMMLKDPTLWESIRKNIAEKLFPAENACYLACLEVAKDLQEIPDDYLRQRANDLKDIGMRLVRNLRGTSGPGLDRVAEGSVIVAEDLAPSDAAALDPCKVRGIVLDRGGKTGHTAILARSMGIPAVVGATEATSTIRTGDIVVVDGGTGEVIVGPDESILKEVRAKVESFRMERERLDGLKDLPSVTQDGRRIEVAANIGSPREAGLVLRYGAEGVGLFRTEFLFIDRDSMPDEEEQFAAYAEVLEKLRPRPVVIRTLDVGGDKKIPYIRMKEEENPFLGVRAVRLCLRERELFRVQLRALLRASAHGNLRIMFPMISTVAELREVKTILWRVKDELERAGHRLGRFEVGIMVETPAAAVCSDILARECDFFSIGTNDLTQYVMAADRGDPELAALNDPFHPAVLRLVENTIVNGHRAGIWVGMCGEMAGMPEAVPLLVGMGIDELSMAASSVPRCKEIVRSLDTNRARRVRESVMSMERPEEIRGYLQDFLARL